MGRGESSGGGQSSLGYLFGSDEKPSEAPPTRAVLVPPYGVDVDPSIENTPETCPPSSNNPISNNYQRAQGQHLGNYVTGRPSTKVKSVPGGDSSLGYLFGGKQ